MSQRDRTIFTSHSDTSAIKIKNMVTDLFTQMRETSPGAPSPRGSTGSLNTSVTKNIGFQSSNSNDHVPWNTGPALSLPKNCNMNLGCEPQSPLQRSISNASALTSLCADLSPSDSHFFEVLYIGKVRISQRKVPDSLIDDALIKFAQHDAEKARISQMRRNSLLSSTGTSLYSNDSKENITEEKSPEKKITLTNTSTTPLEPDKNATWKVDDKKDRHKKDAADFDKEFENFTKERIEKNGTPKKANFPLEPTVVVINVPNKKNLDTLKEIPEDTNTSSDIAISKHSENLDDEDLIEASKTNTPLIINENNPFLPEMVPNNKDPINKSTEILNKNNKEKSRQDSPTPINFDEINRKPKMFLRNKVGLGNDDIKGMPENKPFLRDRSASIGTLNLKTPIAQLVGEQNRTMLFQVGRSDLRLISPDRKQILLHRSFKDVASCVLGRTNKEHFGFVCRENADSYACYVFKCESDSVALEIVNAIRQAFVSHAELLKKSRDKSPNLTCEHCPMLWYHRLCHDIEGMSDKRMHAFILRRLEQLPEDEQDQITTKYQGGTNHIYETSEHNAFLMMLLRAHCESKQLRHVHDTAENRSEFLNQYLGGSTIFTKAKRSLSSGFDHLLKRRPSKDDGIPVPPILIKKESSPMPSPVVDTSSESSVTGLHLTADAVRSKSMSPCIVNNEPTSPTGQLPITVEEDSNDGDENKSDSVYSPMMDIFLKVSDSRNPAHSGGNADHDATWRQTIYQKAIQQADGHIENELLTKNLLNLQNEPVKTGKRTKEELRQLWKMAIDQTILLVRMEKENAKLKESEDASAVRRIKLEYTDLASCEMGANAMWDNLLASRDTSNQVCKVDHHMLTQAVIQGVPRVCRGGVWYFLAEQAALRLPPPDNKRYPLYNVPYRTLLSGLTKHQHAILIDLGRTFPQHSYFASALGPGQLALYNILKAYSLIDPDVGYCQGLSFVAGVLLLHLEESEAFILLRHLMFRRGLRKQYLPDMSALQVQLYQLSRLVRDYEPELHDKLEALDISPALYAAPWMLTLFTSSFPLGFVVRVFDLIFLESIDIVFTISLALLSTHKDGLMLCESCEEAAEYIKIKLPDMDKHMYEKVMKKVHTLDIARQLSHYAVEYAVLKEEMPRVTSLNESNRRLVTDNKKMEEELDSAMEAINNYETLQSKLEMQNKSMEQQLTLLSRYLTVSHKQELPLEIKKIVHNYSKKISFSSKIFSSKFANNDENDDDPKKNFKSGMSTPNLFSKISKDEVMNAVNKEKNKSSPENDRRQFMMKKSQSVHSGLIGNLKPFPLKILEENPEQKRSESFRNSNMITESLKELTKKNTGFFASTHEMIRQERQFEKQLKHDFDENLKKLDAKLSPQTEDIDIFKTKKTLSLNVDKEHKFIDSGFTTPITPDDKKDDNISIVSHPLSDCDVDIKFDGQSTKLKQIRPIIKSGRNNSIESGDFKPN